MSSLVKNIALAREKYKAKITENIVPLKRGDVFEIGNHRLIYGDATDKNDVEKLMNNKLANMIFTDPPFNMRAEKIASVVSDVDFINAGGDMTKAEFSNFLLQTATNLYDFSVDNSIHYICINSENFDIMIDIEKKVYDKFKAFITWDKCNIGLGGFYRSQCEYIFVYQKGCGQNICNFSFKDGRSNLWKFSGQNDFHFEKRQGIERVHPTMKPIKLVADAIKDCSNENDIILDLFGGSGTTMVASHQTNRVCYMAELDEKYVNVIIRRMLELNKNNLDIPLQVICNDKDITDLFINY
jgi:DNA modification methylase